MGECGVLSWDGGLLRAETRVAQDDSSDRNCCFLALPVCQDLTDGISLNHLYNPKQQMFRCLVTQSCPTLCDPMDCSTPGLPVHNQLPELAQTHVL